MKKKIALITGITGQDGSYLAEFLLKKNYIVHGIKRRSSSINTLRIDHIYQGPNISNRNFILHYGDLSDGSSIRNLIYQIKPDEIYNLGAQSHVKVSFEIPEYTSEINGMGVLKILECIKEINGKKKIKFYQASSSEIFGGIGKKLLNEKSVFNPRSPYAISKLFGYYMTKNYRESYNLYACNGILFNHESPRRGETFVTKKICDTLKKIINNDEKFLLIGNLEARRDWGHAKEYVEMMWKMLQLKKPEDFIISTGKEYSVRDFIELCSKQLGFLIEWKNKDFKEVGFVSKILDKKCKLKIGSIIVKVSKKYFRPTEVDFLKGNSNKAKKKLNWKPKYNIHLLIKDMLNNEYN